MARRRAVAFTGALLLAGVLLGGCGGGSPSGAQRAAAEAARSGSPTPSPAVASTPGAVAPGAALPTAAPANVVRDVAYADRSRAETLDLYLPRGTGPHPLVLFVHGGGWVTGDKAGPVTTAVVPVLLGQGYAVASVNYRLAGEAAFPAQVQDVKAALRWVRAHAAAYGVDPDRVVGFGESAGAHTLALVAATWGRALLDDPALGVAGRPATLRGALLWYPPVDLLAESRWLAATPGCAGRIDDPDAATSPESRLLGAPVQSVPDRARAANPVTYLAPGAPLPRLLVEHGDRDCTAPLQGSQELVAAATRAAGPDAARLVVIPGSGHYTDFDAAAAAPAALTFLSSLLGPSGG